LKPAEYKKEEMFLFNSSFVGFRHYMLIAIVEVMT